MKISFCNIKKKSNNLNVEEYQMYFINAWLQL